MPDGQTNRVGSEAKGKAAEKEGDRQLNEILHDFVSVDFDGLSDDEIERFTRLFLITLDAKAMQASREREIARQTTQEAARQERTRNAATSTTAQTEPPDTSSTQHERSPSSSAGESEFSDS